MWPSRTARIALTSRLTPQIRKSGGNVFVRLTAEPTAKAIEVLALAGLTAAKVPDPPTGIVTFDSLKIATVWGWASAAALRRIAALKFVVMVEPSGDPDGIGPNSQLPSSLRRDSRHRRHSVQVRRLSTRAAADHNSPLSLLNSASTVSGTRRLSLIAATSSASTQACSSSASSPSSARRSASS